MEEYQYTFDFGLVEIPFFHIHTSIFAGETNGKPHGKQTEDTKGGIKIVTSFSFFFHLHLETSPNSLCWIWAFQTFFGPGRELYNHKT